MGYIEAIEAAGATVHESEYFGSYQGEVLADITYEGTRGILAFGYGSCGGCDSFESFVGYGDREACDEHSYDAQDDCPACLQAKVRWQEDLAGFGRDMLNGLMLGDEVAKYRADLVEQCEWDGDAPAQLAFLDRIIATQQA